MYFYPTLATELIDVILKAVPVNLAYGEAISWKLEREPAQVQKVWGVVCGWWEEEVTVGNNKRMMTKYKPGISENVAN